MANIQSKQQIEERVRFIMQEITNAACRGTGLVPTDEDKVYILSLGDELKRLSEGRNEVIWDKKGRPSIVVNIFLDEEARLSYLSNNGVVIAKTDNTVHPAFTVDGKHIGGFRVMKFTWCRWQGANYDVSLYNMDPAWGVSLNGALTNVDTTNASQANPEGSHMHLMTLAEVAYLSLLCVRNGFQPRGNDNYGKSSQKTDEVGEPGGYDFGGGKLYEIRTGTGPTSWYHDGTIFGVSDMRGNLVNWIAGAKLMNGKIYIFKDNNAASPNRVKADFDITNVSTTGNDSNKWVSIKPDGSFCAAGAEGCLGYDYSDSKGNAVGGHIVTSLTPQGSDGEGYIGTKLATLDADEGVNIPDIMRQLTLAGDLSEKIQGNLYARTNDERGLRVFGYYYSGGIAGVGCRDFSGAPAYSDNGTSSRSATLIPAV